MGLWVLPPWPLGCHLTPHSSHEPLGDSGDRAWQSGWDGSSPWILPSWDTPGAPAQAQCPSSQQQTTAVPPSSDLGKEKCPALLQEGITPSMTVGVGRAGPGQEGQSISHQLPQSFRDPEWPHSAKGRDSHQLLPPTPATSTQGLALLQGQGWVQHTVVLFPREEEGRGQGTNLNRMKTIIWK